MHVSRRIRTVRIEWEPEDLAYIGSRSVRYPGTLDIQESWVTEAMTDPGLVEVSPYPRSRMGASAFIFL